MGVDERWDRVSVQPYLAGARNTIAGGRPVRLVMHWGLRRVRG